MNRRRGGASDLLSFDMLRVHGGLARHAASFVHQFEATRARTSAGESCDQWMTLQMSTAYRRGLRRRRNGGAGSAATGSEYVCNHHVERRKSLGEGGSAQTVEFDRLRFAHGVWLITPEVCLHRGVTRVRQGEGGAQDVEAVRIAQRESSRRCKVIIRCMRRE